MPNLWSTSFIGYANLSIANLYMLIDYASTIHKGCYAFVSYITSIYYPNKDIRYCVASITGLADNLKCFGFRVMITFASTTLAE